MAKIVRYNGNLVPFASSSLGTERTIFGQVTQANDITSQFTPQFLRGWGIVGPSDQPTLQDFNAVSYTHGQLLSYLHQMGVAEYNPAQEYHSGSITQVGGVLYVSLQNTNVGNPPASSPTFWKDPSKTEGILGFVNLAVLIPAASATATFLASQLVVMTSLTGLTYRLSSFSQAINLATTGAGGMDTGAAPVNGYVAVYAIYNPATGARSVLGVNATSVSVAEVYSGANMPAGYTASALISIYPTNGAGIFVPGIQRGRTVCNAGTQVLSTTTQSAGFSALSIASAVPLNAKKISGNMNYSSVAAASVVFQVAADTGGVSLRGVLGNPQLISAMSYSGVTLMTLQTIYYRATNSASTTTFTITVLDYEF